MTFLTIKMDVTKTNQATKEREPVGAVEIFVPSVAELVADAVQASDKDNKPLFDDEGLPVFTETKYNWLQSAIHSQVKAQARNKLVGGTIDLKAGAQIAVDWAGLTAINTGGGAEHLAAIREVKALFSKWVAGLGKSKQAFTNITDFFNKPDTLKVAKATNKEKMVGYLSDFVDTLTDAEAAKYANYLEKVESAATSEEVDAEDF